MAAVKKLDLYKLHQAEYVAPRKPALVVTKPAVYLMATGQGAPASAEFQGKIGAIYSVAFTIKMAKKFAGQDYRVCHLEGLWSVGQASANLLRQPPETWNWKLLIRVPEFIRSADVKAAIKRWRRKEKVSGPPRCASRRSTKANACRCCTSAPMRLKKRLSRR